MGVIRFWGVFFGLAVAAAAGLQPGPAAAQTQNCGTLATGTNYGDGTYSNGIIHATATSGVTITVPGTAAGQTINTGHGQYGSGILIRVQNANAQRNIAATVGGTGTLQINQTGSLSASVWAHGRGILFVRRAGRTPPMGDGSTVKANIASGVTIGTSSTRMNSHGIALQRSTLTRAGSAGDSCISTAARVYANNDGLHLDNIGSIGDAELYNTGAITAGNRGIYVVNPDTGNKSVTVTNSGAIEVTNANKNGIEVSNNGNGSDTAVKVTNRGAIGTATNRIGTGISVIQQRGSGDVVVTNSGAILATRIGVQATTNSDSSADLTVNLTGGSITTNGFDVGASATAQGTGNVVILVSSGVTVISRHAAAVTARSWHADNTTGKVGVTQAGTLSGRHGVEVLVNRQSAAMETRAASAQPMIDVTWTGTFSHGAGTAGSDTERRSVSDVPAAVTATRETDAEAATRYGEAAGVEAWALDRGYVMAQVAKGDAPDAIAGAAAQTAILNIDSTNAAVAARARAIVAHLKAVLRNPELATIPGAAAIDSNNDGSHQDGEIRTWLGVDNADRRRLIRDLLAESLSEKEMAVLRAVTTGAGLDAALDDADAGFSEDFKTAIRALLDRFNVGNIHISLSDGSIDTRGDGVRAYYATPHEDNGRIDVTVAEDVTVVGGVSGVFVANAGMGDVLATSDLGESLGLTADETLRRQFVTVNGTVTGGTDAAVRLSGGGGLIVGATGKVHAGSSGQAILVDAAGRSAIVIHGEVRGGAGADAAVEATGGGSIAVTETGSVNANGARDGVRARYAAADDDNGRIDVTVAGGGSVSGGGLYVANAGMAPVTAGSAWGQALMLGAGTDTTDLRRQFVTVHGTVTGGTDAAVHLVGGGALLVGETGRLVAGSSGRAILVNDPGRSEIVIHGRVEGGDGAPAAIDMTGGGTLTVTRTGIVRANGADAAIAARRATAGAAGTTRVVVHVAGDTGVEGRVSRQAANAVVENRLQGDFVGDGFENGVVVFVPTDDDGPSGHMPPRPVPIRDDGSLNTSVLPLAAPPPAEPETPALGERTPEEGETPSTETPTTGTPSGEDETPQGMREAAPPFDCDMATDDRCRLYSALPSVLLSMNGLPTYEERLSAARSEAGGWARVETARGDWEADSSTRAEVAWDRNRSGVRVGVDGPVGETGRLGVSVHALRGSADMTRGGGKIELSGVGASVSGTAFVAGGAMYIDAQAAATRYEAKLTSQLGRVLKDGASGAGYALALEAGRPLPLWDGALTLTPRAGVTWSQASMNAFADSRLATRVSVEEASSLLGRAGLGVALEPGAGGRLRVIGSAEATHEFSGEAETQVQGVSLKASPEATGARISLGAVHGWGEGRFALQAMTNYAFGGATGNGFEGALSFAMRF